MTPEEKENLHLAVLAVLSANAKARWGLAVAAVALRLTPWGFSAQTHGGVAAYQNHVADAVAYLEGKQMVEEVAKPADRANRAWRITSAGISYLDERT